MRKVRAALMTEVVNLLDTQFPGLQYIMENEERPTGTGNWVELFFKPADTHVFTLGAGGLDALPGVVMVNVHTQLDNGPGYGISVVDAFRRHFVAGLRVIFEGQEVQVTNCSANLGRVINTWSRADISIGFTAYLTRGVA